MNLLILAAGLGTRLKPITHKIPKPALPILNVPMIFWNAIYFRKTQIQNTVVNTFHLEDVLRERLSDYDHHFIFSSDGKEVLGTGGGIANNKDLLINSEDFWVINGDGFFLSDVDFVSLAEKRHQQTGAICTLVVTDHPGVGQQFGGVWVDAFGKVLAIGKNKPQEAVRGFHFTGFRVLSRRIFDHLPSHGPSELFDTLNSLLKQGHKVETVFAEGDFFETGNEKDFLSTHSACIKFMKDHKYSNIIHSTLEKYSPKSSLNPSDFLIKFAPNNAPKDLFCEERLRVFEGTQFDGFLVTGKNVTIRENCQIKNVVILDNQDIHANSSYKNCIIY